MSQTDPLHRHSARVVDLFAGPGGWSEGLKALGHSELGIEWDDAACATARAAGHERLQADVAALDPCDYPCDGLIASPPCQAWSMAGKGGGRRDVERVIACAMEIAAGADTRAHHAPHCEDARSLLVVEPLRWARVLEPMWIALEQVPPVLELWTLFAQLLEAQGYSTWAGVLEAERYGVPQTRERAVLMAHRERPVHPPIATHQRYLPGEPQRHDITLEGEVLPWISMAEALGWSGQVQTNNFTAVKRDPDGKRSKAGSVPYERPATTPAPTVDTSAGGWGLRAGTNANDVTRPVEEPAPTVRFGARANDVSWVPTHYDRRQGSTKADGSREMVRPVPVSEPAPTIAAQGLAKGRDQWTHERPAPTIVGTRRSKDGMLVGRQLPEGEGENVGGRNWTDGRPATTVRANSNEITAPTYKDRDPEWQPGDPEPSQAKNAVRVTVQEAAVLQSFRPDYPWQGTRTKQFEQVGNAVPPRLARAVLAELVDLQPMEMAA